MIIDLRSDTVTRPTPGMLEAMINANVGDDVFEEDPTVIELEAKAARLFGKEAGLFCPSGTMTNQIAIKVLTQPSQEVICDRFSHIYLYEGGGLASNSGLSVRLLAGDRGRISSVQILENINPDTVYSPVTSLVSLENTCNRGGGSYYSQALLEEIAGTCREKKLFLHLDGARIFNALVETGQSPENVGNLFDTVSVCLSKGLGAPVGSMLLSSVANIRKARRVRKAMGGGMRQAGFLAAAGIYALDNHIHRLKEDHKRARELQQHLLKQTWIQDVLPVETNIVLFQLSEGISPDHFIEKLKEKGVLFVSIGGGFIRAVTHLDFTDDMLGRTLETFSKVMR